MLRNFLPNVADKLHSKLFKLDFVKRGGFDSTSKISPNVLSCLTASKIVRECTQMEHVVSSEGKVNG